MRIAVYGNDSQDKYSQFLERMFKLLSESGAHISVERNFHDYVCRILNRRLPVDSVIDDADTAADIALSIGGDGTFLRTAEKVSRAGIPILGINTGHLGYLADANIDDIDNVVADLFSENYKIEERTVLHVSSNTDVEIINPYALNEVAIMRQDTALMISMHTYVNGRELTTYKADGLIISTPTGSTAYNLSVGGPILDPVSDNIVLSPISPHSLTMRPLVLRDDSKISVTTTSRVPRYRVSVDGRPFSFPAGSVITVEKADFKVKVIQHLEHNFADTLRRKLMWGMDQRTQ